MHFWWVFEDILGVVTMTDQVHFKETLGPLLRFACFFSARPDFYHEIYLV